jgi:hypothetical protein
VLWWVDGVGRCKQQSATMAGVLWRFWLTPSSIFSNAVSMQMAREMQIPN